MWDISFGVVNLPDNWASMTFSVDIGKDKRLGNTADITQTLTKENVPTEYVDKYEGWLHGAISSQDTQSLEPGRYYMQVSLWDNSQPQSQIIPIEVRNSFDRTAPNNV